MDRRTVTLCGPCRTSGRPGPRQHVRGRQSESEGSRCALGSRMGAGATAFCHKRAWLVALCTLITLPETQEGFCFLVESAEVFTCWGISSLCLDARHASPDVSCVLKQLWATESDRQGRERGLRIAAHAKRCTFPEVSNGWVFSCNSARTASWPRLNPTHHGRIWKICYLFDPTCD